MRRYRRNRKNPSFKSNLLVTTTSAPIKELITMVSADQGMLAEEQPHTGFMPQPESHETSALTSEVRNTNDQSVDSISSTSTRSSPSASSSPSSEEHDSEQELEAEPVSYANAEQDPLSLIARKASDQERRKCKKKREERVIEESIEKGVH